MEIINPNEIGVKISTLIAESKERFYAITPYIKVGEWKKIKVNLAQAKERNVDIKFFIREIDSVNYNTLRSLGVEVFQIPNLHTKIYFNEAAFIVSSMNLYEYSDLHSIDIAIQYNDIDSYNKLFDYFTNYIYPKKTNHSIKSDSNRLLALHNYLTERFGYAKINTTDTYLFSNNIIPRFDVFISPNHITLKHPSIKISEEEVKNISTKISGKTTLPVVTKLPTKDYSYCTWDIPISNLSNKGLLDLICSLRDE